MPLAKEIVPCRAPAPVRIWDRPFGVMGHWARWYAGAASWAKTRYAGRGMRTEVEGTEG